MTRGVQYGLAVITVLMHNVHIDLTLVVSVIAVRVAFLAGNVLRRTGGRLLRVRRSQAACLVEGRSVLV